MDSGHCRESLALCHRYRKHYLNGEDPDLFFSGHGNVMIISEDLDGADPDDAVVPNAALEFNYIGLARRSPSSQPASWMSRPNMARRPD
jgi:hypothetical protein